VTFLLDRIGQGPAEQTLAAWWRLLATRDAEALRIALEQAPAVHARRGHPGRTLHEWLAVYLAEEGLAVADGLPRWLHSEQPWHLIFPEGHFARETPAHPTWHDFAEQTGPMRFGGVGSGTCRFCREKLHHILTLKPVPADLGVTGRRALKLEVCLSCLGWEQVELFYRHDERGAPRSLREGRSRITPRFPAGPLKSGEARLGRAGPRWAWQSWSSLGKPNLNRVGGPPAWVQSADYPDCPECGRTMSFLMQLDSNLPAEQGGEWDWGSGGMGYARWCGACRISAWRWQCT
jgi:hypothetical protein